ncbi:MAG: hypothetical protein ACRDP9_07190 [Kribbellaceae bacterium]|nr:hypothetical protein [Kribbellaceae bacterium]
MIGWSGERGDETSRRQEIEIDRQVDDLRAAGHAAYLDHDWDVAVLDLAFDSLVDTPHGRSAEVRRLRFAGHDCAVDVEVRGYTRLTVELWVSPAESVVVESRTPGLRGPRTILWTQGQAMTWMRPQLTSFLLRWPDSDRPPARTAWVLL